MACRAFIFQKSKRLIVRYERVWLLGAFGRNADDLPPEHKRLDRKLFGGITLIWSMSAAPGSKRICIGSLRTQR